MSNRQRIGATCEVSQRHTPRAPTSDIRLPPVGIVGWERLFKTSPGTQVPRLSEEYL
jgi:hypothetical protein